MRKHLFGILLMTSFLACATGASDDKGGGGGSLFPGDSEHEAQARVAVKQRIQFDLECADTQISRISDVTRLGGQMTSMSLGVVGCGKKVSYYVECVSNWGKITCNPRINTAVVQGAPGKTG